MVIAPSAPYSCRSRYPNSYFNTRFLAEVISNYRRISQLLLTNLSTTFAVSVSGVYTINS